MSGYYREEELKSKINEIITLNLDNSNLKGDLIAKKLMVNRMYLHRKLKAFYDLNTRDFILQRRMNFAKEQLIKTNLPIYMISNQIGYYDASYFSKTFKKVTGLSPSEYRKNMI